MNGYHLDKVRPGSPGEILAPVRRQLTLSSQRCGSAIRSELCALLDGTKARVDGAVEMLGDILYQLGKAEDRLVSLLREIDNDIDRLKQAVIESARRHPKTNGDSPQQVGASLDDCRLRCKQYCMLRSCESIYQSQVRYVRDTRVLVKQSAKEFISFRQQLRDFEGRFGQADDASEDSNANVEQASSESVSDSAQENNTASEHASYVQRLVNAFDEKLRVNGRITPSKLVSASDEVWGGFVQSLRKEAIEYLIEGVAEPLDDALSDTNEATPDAMINAIAPRLGNVGGERRVLAILSEKSGPARWPKKLTSHFGDCVTFLDGARSEMFVCCEIQGISIESVINRFLRQNPNLVELASRLHTRIDTDWA